MGYRLGVDLGTTFTSAAVFTDGQVSMLDLGRDAAQIPSVIFLTTDGAFLVGPPAERRGVLEPDRVVREFKRRIGDPVPVVLGGTPYSAHALTAVLLRWVVGVATERQAEPPEQVVVTYPANWGPYKTELLSQALRMADQPSAATLTEPEAAARLYASRHRVAVGQKIAVYDLGGGTFDAAVLRKDAEGFELLGQPEGIEQLGGVDFDEAVFSHVADAVRDRLGDLSMDEPDTRLALARLRRDCVEAKEALSVDTETVIPVVLPGLSTSVRLVRSEFEAMVRPALRETIGAMRRALSSARVKPDDISAIVLVGGSSRIPLVSEMLTSEFGRPVALDTHPKNDVAMGAALAVGDTTRVAVPPPPPVPQPQQEQQPAEPTEEHQRNATPAPDEQTPPEPELPPPSLEQPPPPADATAAQHGGARPVPVPEPPLDEGVAPVELDEPIVPGLSDAEEDKRRWRWPLVVLGAAMAAVAVFVVVVIDPFRSPDDSATATPAPSTPTPTPSTDLRDRYAIGDCFTLAFDVTDCTDPHQLQVTGFEADVESCIDAGESFVGDDPTYTTRVVHAFVPGSDVDVEATGEMCVTALADLAGRQLQTIDFSLEGAVAEDAPSAATVGGCQPVDDDDPRPGLGNAQLLGPCSEEAPWLSGHVYSTDTTEAGQQELEQTCQAFADRFGNGEPRVSTIGLTDFSEINLDVNSATREFYVPLIDVEVGPFLSAETRFQSDVDQALPRPTDGEHLRAVCAVTVDL